MTQLPLDPPLLDIMRDLVTQHGYEDVSQAMSRLRPSLVVASAPARWGDPETSQLASKRERDVGRFSAKSRQAKLLDLFGMRDMTDQQATIHLVGSHAAPSAFDGARRRCSDLRAAGYLFDTGRRRKNAGSDDLSVIWGISAAGQAALVSLADTGWSK